MGWKKSVQNLKGKKLKYEYKKNKKQKETKIFWG